MAPEQARRRHDWLQRTLDRVLANVDHRRVQHWYGFQSAAVTIDGRDCFRWRAIKAAAGRVNGSPVAEIGGKRRPGRPSKGAQAMSSAERQRRYRERKASR